MNRVGRLQGTWTSGSLGTMQEYCQHAAMSESGLGPTASQSALATDVNGAVNFLQMYLQRST